MQIGLVSPFDWAWICPINHDLWPCALVPLKTKQLSSIFCGNVLEMACVSSRNTDPKGIARGLNISRLLFLGK